MSRFSLDLTLGLALLLLLLGGLASWGLLKIAARLEAEQTREDSSRRW